MSVIASIRWVPAILFITAALSVSAQGTEEPGSVGAETCAICHEEVASAFQGSVHAKAGGEGACEACHGGGEAHVDAEGDIALIRRFAEDPGGAGDAAACLRCHGRERKLRGWSGSGHAGSGMSCSRCHTVHGGRDGERLVPSESADSCYTCHQDVQAEFSLTVTHPVERGNLQCWDCHNPHTPSDRSLLGGFKQVACLGCHTEYRGPWFFEHEAVAVEGCIACHTPHGSVNRFLLTYQRVGDLCMQCHPAQPFSHVAVDGSGDRTTAFNDCTRCHIAIHGSNNSALFLD